MGFHWWKTRKEGNLRQTLEGKHTAYDDIYSSFSSNLYLITFEHIHTIILNGAYPLQGGTSKLQPCRSTCR